MGKDVKSFLVPLNDIIIIRQIIGEMEKLTIGWINGEKVEIFSPYLILANITLKYLDNNFKMVEQQHGTL